jgi:hypothetical protein
MPSCAWKISSCLVSVVDRITSSTLHALARPWDQVRHPRSVGGFTSGSGGGMGMPLKRSVAARVPSAQREVPSQLGREPD